MCDSVSGYGSKRNGFSSTCNSLSDFLSTVLIEKGNLFY